MHRGGIKTAILPWSATCAGNGLYLPICRYNAEYVGMTYGATMPVITTFIALTSARMSVKISEKRQGYLSIDK